MKLQLRTQQIPIDDKLLTIQELYSRYGGMLLGYLTDIVIDHQIAEQYLVDIFKDISSGKEEIILNEKSIWLQLQSIAKSRLTPFTKSFQECKAHDEAKHAQWTESGSRLSQFNPMQRTVFCGMYYHSKSVNLLAQELDESEETVKRAVKEAFNIIRNGR